MDMLGLTQTIDKMAKASEVTWLGHVLRKEDGDVATGPNYPEVQDVERTPCNLTGTRVNYM